MSNLDHSRTSRHLRDTQSISTAVTKYHRRGSLSTHAYLGSGGWEVCDQGASRLSLWREPSFGQRQWLLAVSSHGRRGEGRSVESEGTNPIHEGSTLITKAPPKGPTSRYHHGWGVRISTYELGVECQGGRDTTFIYSLYTQNTKLQNNWFCELY